MTIAHDNLLDANTSRFHPFWRGHLFLFDRPQPPTYSSVAGLKLILIVIFLELAARPLLGSAAASLHIAHRDWWTLLQLSLLTALALGLVAAFARLPLSQLGLYSWRRWSKTEKLYFLQIVPITIAVFSFFVSAELKAMCARHDLFKIAVFLFLPKMIWGFYQEFLYRGLLQTELIRRWGVWKGLLAANLIFTFGPLHFYHFHLARAHPSHLWIFADIFSIGLFFALVFHRSGNLWIVAILHGLGDWFIDGLADIPRLLH